MTTRNGNGDCYFCQTPVERGEDCGCDGAEIERLRARVEELEVALRPIVQRHIKYGESAMYHDLMEAAAAAALDGAGKGGR